MDFCYVIISGFITIDDIQWAEIDNMLELLRNILYYVIFIT